MSDQYLEALMSLSHPPLLSSAKHVLDNRKDRSPLILLDMETANARTPEEIIHYDCSEVNPDSPYPPPTFIDFASGNLHPHLTPTRCSPLIFHCKWLGGHHDGYPLAATLYEYSQLRQNPESAPGTLEYAALVQSTFSFGLLEAVLRIKIPESYLLSHAADGTTTLSTANLPILCRDLYYRSRVRHHPDKCRAWLNNVAVTLCDAYRGLVMYFVNRSTTSFLAADLPQEASDSDILRALCMIGHSLNVVLRQSPSECNPNHITLSDCYQLPGLDPAKNQLQSRGWCPLIIAALAVHGFIGLEYARSFPPFLRHAGEHDGCTDTACTVNNIDPAAYTQRHCSDECDCASIIPPFHPVESLLSVGRIPVVTTSDEGITVLVAEDVPYVAISHVWVDGLGSTTEEGLPACQVSRIASMVSSLVPSCAFWIDGLCVPKQKNLRKRAIELMAKTYAEAAAVLVIDRGIRSCSTNAPLEERLLRIVTSGWLQRLWTYQEAMLAKKLCFEFADGLVDLEDLLPSHDQVVINPLLAILSFPLWDIRRYLQAGASADLGSKLGDVAYALRWRTTSRIEDETLAIAGLLHIDIRELLDASSPDERMKSLLLQKRTVAPAMLFTLAPKISGIPGFSWAPRSFMTGAHSGASLGEESATCTPTGLLAEYAFFIFSELVEIDEDVSYVIRDTRRPPCGFLLQPVVHIRDTRREACNAILIDGNIAGVIGSNWACVGVRMVEDEEGATGAKEQVCHYQEIAFNLGIITVSEASRMQNNGTPVIDAKSIRRMKVRVM